MFGIKYAWFALEKYSSKRYYNSMVKRKEYDALIDSLENYPVVGLLGARQTGKTTLAKQVAKKCGAIYLDLENPQHQARLSDPVMFLEQQHGTLCILDETQRMPEIFPVLRALVDRDNSNGKFMLLGSASPELLRQASESLAGRIRYHEMLPFCIDELPGVDIDTHWLRGGFPRSFLSSTDKYAMDWLESFIKTFLERDLNVLNFRISAVQMRRFWTMLAHCQGQLFNASRLAGSLAVSSPTVQRWLDILCDTYMVHQLMPWHSNTSKRLVKSPKVYLRDSGIVHRLLGIESIENLLSHPVCGLSWEGYVIEQIAAVMPFRTEMYHYRTSNGAEIDLLLKIPGHTALRAVEIKRSSAPSLERGFWSSFKELKCERGFVVYPGEEIWPVGEGVVTLPVTEIDKIFQ